MNPVAGQDLSLSVVLSYKLFFSAKRCIVENTVLRQKCVLYVEILGQNSLVRFFEVYSHRC